MTSSILLTLCMQMYSVNGVYTWSLVRTDIVCGTVIAFGTVILCFMCELCKP